MAKAKANENQRLRAFRSSPLGQQITAWAQNVSPNIDVDMLNTAMWLESGGNPEAQAKSTSATGLFQPVRGTWAQYMPGVPWSKAKDPQLNTVAGARIMDDLRNRVITDYPEMAEERNRRLLAKAVIGAYHGGTGMPAQDMLKLAKGDYSVVDERWRDRTKKHVSKFANLYSQQAGYRPPSSFRSPAVYTTPVDMPPEPPAPPAYEQVLPAAGDAYMPGAMPQQPGDAYMPGNPPPRYNPRVPATETAWYKDRDLVGKIALGGGMAVAMASALLGDEGGDGGGGLSFAPGPSRELPNPYAKAR